MEFSWKPLTLQSVLKALNVAKKGETDGSNNLPSQNDNGSAVESEILGEFKSHWQSEVKKSQQAVAVAEEKLGYCTTLTRSDGHTALFEGEKLVWNGIKDAMYLKLDTAVQKKNDVVAQLRAFRIANNIQSGREPAVRGNLKLFFACMIPVALAGIEIFLNFEVLRPILGSGAIPWALIVSAVNIGFAFYMGRMCITNLMHPVRTSSRPSNYFILIIFILALIVYVNFFMGVFRGLNEAADLIPRSNVAAFLQAKTDAMYDALQPWNHLNDINAGSVQLLFLAITFSFASMVDGYFFDDPINGYGSLGRKVARAKTKLKEITKQGQVQVTSFIARANDVLDKKRELRDKANHDWYEIIQAYDAANKDHFPNFNESIKGNIEAAINTYREKNVIFRTEALPEFMNNPIDTSFIKDFPSMHQGVVFHLIDDPEIEKIYRENNELINKEYVETKGLYTEHFGREQDEVYARIREVNLG